MAYSCSQKIKAVSVPRGMHNIANLGATGCSIGVVYIFHVYLMFVFLEVLFSIVAQMKLTFAGTFSGVPARAQLSRV